MDIFGDPDTEAQADIDVAKANLLAPTNTDTTTKKESNKVDSGDWSEEEEEEIRTSIQQFLNSTDTAEDRMERIFTFPPKMGSRKRKLIHFVACQFDLAHWSVGEKSGDKTVAIARRGQKKTKLLEKERKKS